MLKEIAEALKPREEVVTIGGVKLLVREMPAATDLTKGDDNSFFNIMVLSIFTEDGQPAMTAEDIPALKLAGLNTMSTLMSAVQRVNGLDVKGETGKSEAGPT